MRPRDYTTTDKRRGLGVVPQTDMRRLVSYIPAATFEKLSAAARSDLISNSRKAQKIIEEYFAAAVDAETRRP